MLEKEEFEKDTIQLKKSKIKVTAVTSLIPELIKLNNELSIKDRKSYTILLDYINHDNYNNFIVDIRRSDKINTEPMLRIHFCLKNLETGLILFNNIMDCFVENSDILYAGFTIDQYKKTVISYDIVAENKIEFEYRIHTNDEYIALDHYNNELYKRNLTKVKIKN